MAKHYRGVRPVDGNTGVGWEYKSKGPSHRLPTADEQANRMTADSGLDDDEMPSRLTEEEEPEEL